MNRLLLLTLAFVLVVVVGVALPTSASTASSSSTTSHEEVGGGGGGGKGQEDNGGGAGECEASDQAPEKPSLDYNGSSDSTICLNMIVKNEVRVLPRLLRSVKDVVDYYVIVDTGSTDDTIPLISRTMDVEYDIPGHVYERPWVDFGTNRQQALELAVAEQQHRPSPSSSPSPSVICDWLLFIDADEELVVPEPKNFRERLQRGTSYLIEKRHHDGMRNAVPNLIDVTEHTWKWEGVVHESLSMLSGMHDRQEELLGSVWIIIHPNMESARSHGITKEQKFLRDAALLERELDANPDDARSMFYLGQSYKDAGHYQDAYDAYRKRIAMVDHGWEEERFYAQYMAGNIAENLNMPEQTVVGDWLAAYGINPQRAEPLHSLARYYRRKQMYGKAYGFAMAGSHLPNPNDGAGSSAGGTPDFLFVHNDIYEWKLLDELCVAAYYIGRYADGEWACTEILQKRTNDDDDDEGFFVEIPEDHIQRIQRSLEFYHNKKKEKKNVM